MTLFRQILIVAICLSSTAFAKPDAALKDIIATVQRAYDSTKDLHAEFEQQVNSPNRKARVLRGEVWLKKPGRMRWDYTKPEKKLMVSDGATLWVYEPEDEQAFKQDVKNSTLPTSVSVLMGEGKLAEEFEITRVQAPELPEQPGQVTLKLVPKKATAAYRYLYMVVDEKTGVVDRTMLFDQQGGTSLMAFKNSALNQGVADAKFKFTPPAGTKVVESPKP